MHFESSSSSSSSLEMVAATTDPSMITASSHKKTAGRNKTRHPFYRGVRRRDSGKWVSEVREPNTPSRIWLGTYLYPEMAAVAHDVAALALHGEAAALNFPDSAHRLPRPASSSHQDIQMAALEAARDFTPSSRPPSTSSTFSHNESKDQGMLESSSTVETSSSSGGVEFVDEEAMFNMPLLLDSMAEGMLLTPPAMKKGFNWSQDVDDDIDLTLWND